MSTNTPAPNVRIGVFRLAAIIFIYLGAAIAWLILGGTIDSRTHSSDDRLHDRVGSTWGTAQEQAPPSASFDVETLETYMTVENSKSVQKTQKTVRQVTLPLAGSKIDVKLNLEPRQKGLMWYSTYTVWFNGEFQFRNPSDKTERVNFNFPFPASSAKYDDLQVLVNGVAQAFSNETKGAAFARDMKPGETAEVRVGYQSNGLDQWRYRFGDAKEGAVSQVSNFDLHLTTNFKDIDFADNTLSPKTEHEIPGGWELDWKYRNLVSGFQIALVMPEKLQPGPLAGQISYFAPVSLFFFFFIMLVISTIRNIELHPMNYFFLAAAFFAFHLMLAYLVDHISIHAAFVVASIVSVFLVVSYLRLVAGLRFAAIEAGGAQFLYLVLFSYAFFFKGFTGLAVTIGSVLTLFVVMQLTGRIRWADKFGGRVSSAPAA
ncbi:MAG TPA: inner membrane CreD family protein [Bryobacteraceae bacterium]|jgi:inner membrane protein involved in colicin E2 resistance